MRNVFAVFIAPLFVCSTLLGQALTIGTSYGGSPNSSDGNIAPTRTDISLTTASANGSISTVHVYWSSAGCTNALKIKFFRRSGNSLTLTAERGPFTPPTFDSTLTLSPPVPVLQGDLIGVARVASCGNAGTLVGITGDGYLQYAGDVTGTVDVAAATRSGALLFLYGTGSATAAIVRVIPVVGSVTGAFGSNFKTEVQLMNPNASSVNGTIIFHPAGTSGSQSDPSGPYVLAPGQVVDVGDAVGALGQTGLGSFDFLVPTGQALPVVVTKVFNDAGVLGTSGFTEDLIKVSGDDRVLFAGATGFMITPPDPSKARFNIGIRTLSQGVELTAVLKDASGATLTTVTKTYQPNWFEQGSASAFFNGFAIGPNQTVQISVSSGSAIIYGSTTDNTTNDPAIQFMRVVFAIA